MYKNLKIAINDQQPLDEVVRELERLGMKGWCRIKDNIYYGYLDYAVLTTLAELKEIK